MSEETLWLLWFWDNYINYNRSPTTTVITHAPSVLAFGFCVAKEPRFYPNNIIERNCCCVDNASRKRGSMHNNNNEKVLRKRTATLKRRRKNKEGEEIFVRKKWKKRWRRQRRRRRPSSLCFRTGQFNMDEQQGEHGLFHTTLSELEETAN